MKKLIFPIILFTLFTITYISCKSTPASGTTAPAPVRSDATQVQTALDMLKNPISRADEARKRAIDFECPAYFPSEWDAIEEQYNTAGNMPKTTQSEIQQVAEAYDTVADAYDDLFKKTIPLYAQAREDEIISARNELIDTGFTRFFPEYLQNADKIALSAQEQFEAGDYYKARDTAAGALDEYETLLIGANAFLARQEIMDYNLMEHDSENFAKADEIIQAAMNKYETGDKEAAKSNAEEALLLFNVVLENGWSAYADEMRALAASQRELALAEKVNIASRDSFLEADTQYNQAETNYTSGKYKDAAISYISSEKLFTAARQDTEEKRLRALDVIKIAEEKVEGSSEIAIEAERVIEGGSR